MDANIADTETKKSDDGAQAEVTAVPLKAEEVAEVAATAVQQATRLPISQKLDDRRKDSRESMGATHSFTHENPPPASQLFVPGRTRNKGNFLCIALIAPEDDQDKNNWKSDDALGAWCTICNVPVMWKKGESNGLSRHMRKFHVDILRDAGLERRYDSQGKPTKRQKTSPSARTSLRNTSGGGFSPRFTIYHQRPRSSLARRPVDSQAKFDALSLLWLYKNLRQYSLADDEGLQDLISFASSNKGEIEFSSSEKLRVASENLRARCEDKIAELVKKEVDYFSLTVDTWSGSSDKSFISVSVHYCTSDFESKTLNLLAGPLPQDSSTESISELLTGTLGKYGLSTDKLTMSMSGGTNPPGALDSLNAPTHDSLGFSFFSILGPFFCDTAAVSIDDVAEFEMDERAKSILEAEHVKVVRSTVHKLRQVALLIRDSQAVLNKMRDILEAQMTDNSKVLELDEPNDWASTYEMIEAAHKSKNSISTLLVFLQTDEGKKIMEGREVPALGPSDWALIAGIRILTMSFFSLKGNLEAESNPTVIYAYPFIYKVEKTIKMSPLFQNMDGGKDIRELGGKSIAEAIGNFMADNEGQEYFDALMKTLDACQTTLRDEIEARFGSLGSIFQWATMLDPRLRKLNHCNEEERNKAKNSLVAEMVAVASITDTKTASSQANQENSSQRTFPDMFGDVFDDPGEGQKAGTKKEDDKNENASESAASDELREYLAAHSIPKNVSPLHWWQANAQTYPLLSRVARKWLSVVISIWSANDRSFSNAGLVKATRSGSLEVDNPDFVDQFQTLAKMRSLNLSIEEVGDWIRPEKEEPHYLNKSEV